MELAQKVIAATIILILAYYFFKDPGGTNQIISGSASGYADIVKALQGRSV